MTSSQSQGFQQLSPLHARSDGISGCLGCGVPTAEGSAALLVPSMSPETTSVFHSKDSSCVFFRRPTLDSEVLERGKKKMKPMGAISLKGSLGFGILRILESY